MEKLSEKIRRNPARGGAPNALFIQAAAEDLPREFDGLANRIHVNFPWGSLLRAVVGADAVVLSGIRRLCAPDCVLEVVVGIDPLRDHGEIDRLGLRALSPHYIEVELPSGYAAAGFEAVEIDPLRPDEWARLATSWAKRLRGNPGRTVVRITARAA